MTAPAISPTTPGTAADVPAAWYNVLADRDLTLPTERSATGRNQPGPQPGMSLNVPKSLVRQSLPLQTWVGIPDEVLDAYRSWRPTPLRRARRLEQALGARARIYYKNEAGNVAGSHKLLTAFAQAYYYARSGGRTLVTCTAAGQWGTAVAAAAARFGMRCTIYMVPGSYERKPGRRAAMELLGADVRPAPAQPGKKAALGAAMSHAVQEAHASDEARWILGGSEPFAILHSTTIGLEAREQLSAAGEDGDVTLIGYLGGGKNVCGLGLPFLADGGRARIRAVESTAYPALTRGRYGFDVTDGTGLSPRGAMYSLGYDYPGAPIQAEGMRYHAAPKLVSELRRRDLLEAVAYDEAPVFASAQLLLATEGVLPSAEAAYAVHDACEQAVRPENENQPIVFCLSDHGYFDTDAYIAYLNGGLADVSGVKGLIEEI